MPVRDISFRFENAEDALDMKSFLGRNEHLLHALWLADPAGCDGLDVLDGRNLPPPEKAPFSLGMRVSSVSLASQALACWCACKSTWRDGARMPCFIAGGEAWRVDQVPGPTPGAGARTVMADERGILRKIGPRKNATWSIGSAAADFAANLRIAKAQKALSALDARWVAWNERHVERPDSFGGSAKRPG